MTQQATFETTRAPAQEALARVVIPARGGVAESPARDTTGEEALIADELLVEEVSIDGMCGVY